jgi:hypothetical protein
MRLGWLWLVGVVAVGSGCAEEAELESTAEPVTSITWTNVVGASATGNDLVKTAAGTLWDAGASSVEGLAGDGYVEFTTGENTTDKMAGLGNGDSDQGYADIAFAIRLNGSGSVAVFEGGVQRGSFGSYRAGDAFRVQVLDGVVTYWRNGLLLYTSAAAASFPLVVDTSLRTPGATIQDVVIEDLVFWKAVRRSHAVASDLVKTDPNDSWNAGAVSRATLAGDGFVQFTTAENTTDKIGGLGSDNSGVGYADVEFGIFLRSTGRFSVYEAGTSRGGFGRYVAGDVFRVQVVGGVVSYWKNGVRFYTSLVTPSFPLMLDTSLRTPGASIEGAKLVEGVGEEVCLTETQRISGESFPAGEFGVLLGAEVSAATGLLVAGTYYAEPPFAAVYRPGVSGWELEQVLTRNDGQTFHYAESIATDGDTIAVSDSSDTSTYHGAIFLYRNDGTQWVEDGLVTGCTNGTAIGENVAIAGNRVVTGASISSDATLGGRAYVFRRTPGNGWVREAILTPPNAGFGDSFGAAVAIAGDRVFIGAPTRDTRGQNAGAVFIYRHDGTAPPAVKCADLTPGPWQLEAVLFASNIQANDWFGYRLAVSGSGSELLAGNPQMGTWTGPLGERVANGPGTVHLFSWSGSGWHETAKLEGSRAPSTPIDSQSWFGNSLAFGGPDSGAPSFFVVGHGDAQTAWVFRSVGGGAWAEAARLADPEGQAQSGYGSQVAATDDSALVAAPSWDATATPNAGAVYNLELFECPAP